MELRSIRSDKTRSVTDKYGTIIEVGDTVIITNKVTKQSIKNRAKAETVTKDKKYLLNYDPDRVAVITSFERCENQGRIVDRVNIITDAAFNTWRLHYNLKKIEVVK